MVDGVLQINYFLVFKESSVVQKKKCFIFAIFYVKNSS